MKLNFNKKSIVGIIVFLFALVLIAVGYFYFNPYKTISYDGFSFSYPKEFYIDDFSLYPESKYKQYRIYNSQVQGFNRSHISISLPIKNFSLKKTLFNNTRSEFRSLIKPITINEHDGEIVTYHLDTNLPEDRPVKAQITSIFLYSEYENTPLILHYTKDDKDHSLDKAWEIILKTLKHK